MNADLLERVARAICAAYGDEYDEQPNDLVQLREWRGGEVHAHDPGLPTKADWLDMARAALAEIEAAGYAITIART